MDRSKLARPSHARRGHPASSDHPWKQGLRRDERDTAHDRGTARPPRAWLDAAGKFRWGKHVGQLAEDVAREDPGYLAWICNEVEDIVEEDREVLATWLKFRDR